jgi:phage FluMu protein Com
MASIKCDNCGEMIALSSGIGSVGAKRFTCPRCGHVTDFGRRRSSDIGVPPENGPSDADSDGVD